MSSVNVDGTSGDTLNWSFDQNVTQLGPNVPELMADTGAGLVSPDVCGQIAPNLIAAQYLGGSFISGAAWSFPSDPSANLTSPGGFVVPESGTLP